MKVAIIGGGFTGLAAAIELVDVGMKVVVYEAENRWGGLAGGFRPSGWSWSLEKYYHHVFANDKAIIEMAKKVDWPVFLVNPKTETWKDGVTAELDSPLALLRYRQLSLFGRMRMGIGLAILKVAPLTTGIKFERYRVVEMLPRLVGKEGYKKIWKPLLMAKFGSKVDQVNMAWFWARIYKRTKRLGYFKGGFEKLAERMAEYVEKKGGETRLGVKINKIKGKKEMVSVDGEEFDKVILTVPAPSMERMVGAEVVRQPEIEYLWGQTLILELNESLMPSYWLNILEQEWPFLVVVEQTRLIGKRHYGGKRVVYVGNYLEEGDRRLKMDEKQLLELFWPFLRKINPDLRKSWVGRTWKFQSPFAQPVFPVNYSKEMPVMKTGMPGVYLANMSMVYPWDRGTNYAVELGVRVAREVLSIKDGLG